MTAYYLTLFTIAFGSTWWIFKKVLRIAIMKDIVDNPDARKLQKAPVPVLGGIAVFFGIIVSLTATGMFFETRSLFAIMGVMAIMLYVGTMDDILGLSPTVRFIIEIIVVLLLVFCNYYSLNDFHGLWGVYAIPEWLAIPVTVFACVGIINSINLLDGVNGLSSGYCITACIIFFFTFVWADDKEAASLAVMSIGSLIPFFCHNVFGKKSKMFMGDGGTLLMGTIMSTFVIEALNMDSPLADKVGENFGMIAFTIAVLSITIFDTLRVMVMRIIRHKSPFQPDKTHLHHLLLDLGFSHIGVTMTEILSNLMVVTAWWISYKMGASVDVQLYLVVALGMLVTFGFYKFARIQIQKETACYRFMLKIGKLSHITHTPWFERFRNFLDMGVIE